ncbi:MAG: LysM peptidoglycan-binding domain-containing protein [Lachnospiraceae bacterium]|nr:LysM peptidoglycan-binding domain-containing protein [Lachnospiraceae bacterium]
MNRRKSVRVKKIRRLRNIVKTMMGISFGIVILLFVCTSFADAHNERTKYYTSVLVEDGDSLWSLANEYSSEEYRDNHDYIKEVKQINHISSDEIHEGSYLLMPYYN